MDQQPLFSVLIANFNNGRFIRDCIGSVLEQTHTCWEVIFVDDGSTDNSLEVITGFAEKDDRIKVFRNKENTGCGYTKRKCAELATGEICGFLDPDDALVENAIELSVKEHLENPNASLVYSLCYQTDER